MAKTNDRFTWTSSEPGECLDTIESLLNKKLSVGWKPVRVTRGNKKFVFEPCEPGAYFCKTSMTINFYLSSYFSGRDIDRYDKTLQRLKEQRRIKY